MKLLMIISLGTALVALEYCFNAIYGNGPFGFMVLAFLTIMSLLAVIVVKDSD